jgi:TetR/AcrR family transcriptional regulator, mexJK operon transcriptional repressor
METPVITKPGRDDRRAAIVDIAHAAFLADGYASTSMSTIAARVGGSKATLYNYFSSKEELFAAVVCKKSEQLQVLLHNAQVEGGDFRSAMQNFGERFLALLLRDESIATYRLVVAECARFPELGRTLYETGMKQGRGKLAEYFRQMIAAGELRDCDAVLMANYFFDLCMSGIHHRRLWNVEGDPTPEEIHAQVARAIAIVLAAFGTGNQPAGEVARLCAKS